MARPTGFNSGFSTGELGPGNKANLLVIPGTHPRYEDGDILCAINKRRIREVNAERICHVKHAGFNSDGLRQIGTINELFLKKTSKYKFERISATEVRRTIIGTPTQHVLSHVPILLDGRMQAINVAEFLARRKRNPKHAIFGTDGSEIWYGKRITPSWSTLNSVWQDIEDNTLNKETDNFDWPFSQREMSRFLVLSVDDFSDAEAGRLTEPVVRETGTGNGLPEFPEIVKMRRNFIKWRTLRDVVEGDVLDFSKQVDIRGRKHVRQQIVEQKIIEPSAGSIAFSTVSPVVA